MDDLIDEIVEGVGTDYDDLIDEIVEGVILEDYADDDDELLVETMPPLLKEDLVFLATLRRLPKTIPALWKISVTELTTLIGMLTPDECVAVEGLRAARAAFDTGQSVKVLDAAIKAQSLTASAGMSRGGMIDVLVANPAPAAITLDADQAAAVAMVGIAPRLYVHAGPGAGKTTTICHMIAVICRNPTARVLALVFNREAENELGRRLRRLGVAVIDKKKIKDAAVYGCAVLTFHKFGFWDSSETLIPPDLDEAEAAAVDGYRRQLDGYVNKLRREPRARGWTHVVLDEAQDINAQFGSLVELLLAATPAPRLIVAGDPRQELYDGCNWFSERWRLASAAEKMTLRYNHRSAPEIVAVLNEYSRLAFPTMHVEQVATRATAGTFRAVAGGGDEVGRLMAASAAGASYGLVPVSLQKWDMVNVVLAARQVIHEEQPGVSLDVLYGEDKEINAMSHVFATAKKIKGLERPRVVVFGVDLDYSGTVPKSALARLLYVALSRARDELYLVVPAAPPRSSPTLELVAPLVKDVIAMPQRAASMNFASLTVTVADYEEGLINVEDMGLLAHCAGPSFPAMTIVVVNDADFVLVYLKALLAKSLGAVMMTPRNVDVSACPDRNKHRLGFADGRWQIVTSEATAAELKTLLTSFTSDEVYTTTMLIYTFRAGRVWTVSSRVQSCQITGDRLAAAIRKLYGDAPVKYNSQRNLPLRFHRRNSEEPAGMISYIPDLVVGDTVIMLKHVQTLTDTHRRQAAIYATAEKRETCLLLNMMNGVSELVSAFPMARVVGAARAVIASRNAKTRAGVLAARGVRYSRPHDVAIAVDVESGERGGPITEIGAVAFNPSNGQVYSTFHEIAEGVVAIKDTGSGGAPGDIVRLTCLRIVNIEAAMRCTIVDRYKAWADTVASAATVLHWGGSERALKRPADTTVDVMQVVFRPWLVAGGDKRLSGTKLANAVEQLLPLTITHPYWHRAFEDALGTMMVYIVAVNHESAC